MPPCVCRTPPPSPAEGDAIENVDTVIWAIGRTPSVHNIGLEMCDVCVRGGLMPTFHAPLPSSAGVSLDERGRFIKVDDAEATTAPGVYALGDVIARPQLTPVAIAAGRRLADRLYGMRSSVREHYRATVLDVATTTTTTQVARTP